jgi:hypothetical protein
LQALQQTLPISSDAAHTTGAQTIRVRGGAHLSIALTLGAAFPETRFATLEVLDRFDNVWSSRADRASRDLTESEVALASVDSHGPAAIAIALTANPDTQAFETLVSSGGFAAAIRLDLVGFSYLNPNEGGVLAIDLADRRVEHRGNPEDIGDIRESDHDAVAESGDRSRFSGTSAAWTESG